MDFIERLTGLSPDNGDGSLELQILIVVVIAVAAGLLGYRYWRARR